MQLYREVLEVSDLQQIPDWIVMPEQRQENPIKARIVALYQNKQKNSDKALSVLSMNHDNSQIIE